MQVYEEERNQKRDGDPRRDFLTNVFIPHIIEKRWQLEWWRPADLAALDKEAEEKAGRPGTPMIRQAAPSGPAARRSRESPFSRGTAGRKTGLRWAPKVAIQCTQGTSVPEAKEVEAELDFKFGHKDVISPKDCERLSD